MTDSPDAIRDDIERTRRELGADVDALADKVTPSKIVDRKARKVRSAFTSVRERVMGVADDAGDAAHDLAEGTADAARGVKDYAQGNPIAVGMIAFGVGLLAASLIPASRKEREVATAVKEQAQPLVDQAAGVAKEVAGNLKEPAMDAVTAVKDRAGEAAEHVKTEASGAVTDVKERTREAGDTLADR